MFMLIDFAWTADDQLIQVKFKKLDSVCYLMIILLLIHSFFSRYPQTDLGSFNYER